MPVTIKSAPHEANRINRVDSDLGRPRPGNACGALPNQCLSECKEVLQCGVDFDTESPHIRASNNGFLHAVIAAYNSHSHLRIRPEDVWLTVLTQLSAYVNLNAKKLRGKFVSHEGKKELVLNYNSSSRYAFDFSIFARDMANLLEENVVDPELRDWIIPDFSTSTAEDKVIASIVMMASLQEYFIFQGGLLCGIPSVTLLGERADWEKLLRKLDKLTTFGKEPKRFHKLLRPVLARFVRSFDEPNSPETFDFWQRIVTYNHVMSGASNYTGWITAFCFWDGNGECIYRPGSLQLDGVTYGYVGRCKIPPGWTRVPVKLIDNGEELESVMVAGSTLIDCSSSGKELQEGGVGLDTRTPRLCWWIYEKKPGPSIGEDFPGKRKSRTSGRFSFKSLNQKRLRR